MSRDTQTYKRQAAAQALQLVEPGMVLGLGTGSTAMAFISLLAERMKTEHLDLRCVATSEQTHRFAEQCGVAIADFNSIADVDLTVDGADEIDPSLNLIKGGGGALLREKIVAMASDRVCIIADSSKLVSQLGAFPLPVEIVDFGLAATLAMIETAANDAECNGKIELRRNQQGDLFRTDGGHLIADCAFGAIPDAELLADLLDIIPGVVEHGLFIGIANEAIVAGPEGVKVLRADDICF
ncbi:MAG: ribose-5-phosphate isomerase RpiA [Rhodomicrobium sp.]|nr:ribose-5-phosphate isomerase RpiA [Rhodomicrobium sp.]